MMCSLGKNAEAVPRMHELQIVVALLMAIAMGWSIGANDAANSLGTAVGSKMLSLRRATVLIVICGILGALLQGQYVSKTIGNNIVRMSALDPETKIRVALIATMASCLWVALATYVKMPISTSHSIVGAVAGAGLAIHVEVHWKVLYSIFICWVATPFGAALMGAVLFAVLRVVFPRVVPEKHSGWVLKILIILSGCHVAFSWGANDVANATGVLEGAEILTGHYGVAIGGVAIALGIVTWGYKVIETIGTSIAHLTPLMAFSAQLASAINVHAYTLWGIPVSTSHSIVGAIFGVAAVKGVRVVNMRIMREIVVCWVATPFISGVMCFLLLKAWALLPVA